MKAVFIMPVALAVVYVLLIAGEAKMSVEDIPTVPVAPTQEIMVDVVTRERDLLQITSQWPFSLKVENVSEKEVSGFSIEIFAANDEGGPGRWVRWGQAPDYGKQDPLFKPKEVMNLPIKPEIVKTFQENNKPFLYIQLADVWVNNDPITMYKYGAELRQDPNNPRRYVVVVDAKGRARPQHNHGKGKLRKESPARNHAIFAHISHSVSPPFQLLCCNREFYDFVTFDCTPEVDPCDVNKFCYIENDAFTLCSSCCTALRTMNNFPCYSHNPFCEHICVETRAVTHIQPCRCCRCS